MNLEKGCKEFENGYPCFLPAQKILHTISRKWAIQIIYLLGNGNNLRYNEIKSALQRGWKKDKISDATLSARLSELEAEELLIRKVYAELPPRVEYSLSNRGVDLSQALQPLIQWAIAVCHENMKAK
ncbi:MAG: helix-turn-helix domain-containing protein [Asgard group archaeon]|nr:helix-turn-helix domain-containing protein [Asgard group archaeon]